MNGKDKTPRVLLVSLLVFGLTGIGRGLDEGTISGCLQQTSFKQQFGMMEGSAEEIANRKGNVAAMVDLGCIAGCIIATVITDKIGRKRVLQLLLVTWLIGVIIQVCSFANLGQLYAGRFISGMGLGMSAVTCPIYLVEVSTPQHRGFCTCLFTTSVYIGIASGYFSNWGTSQHVDGRMQWVIPVLLQICVSGCLLIGSFFTVESPRWLFEVGQDEKGIETLAAIRGVSKQDAAFGSELEQVYAQLAHDKQVGKGTSRWGILKTIFLCRSIRIRLVIAVLAQLFAQWSGSGAVTLFAPDLFHQVGIQSQNDRMFATSMLGIVKLVGALACTLLIIDKLGRKTALYLGISCQMLSLLYISVFFGVQQTASLVTQISPSYRRASAAALVALFVNGLGWALGWNSVQFLVSAEMFPLTERAMANALSAMFHYIFLYSCAKATPSMLVSMKNWGAMLFYVVICILGMVFVCMMVPELAGMSLENIDDLFENRWYKIGRISTKIRQQEQKIKQQQAERKNSV